MTWNWFGGSLTSETDGRGVPPPEQVWEPTLRVYRVLLGIAAIMAVTSIWVHPPQADPLWLRGVGAFIPLAVAGGTWVSDWIREKMPILWRLLLYVLFGLFGGILAYGDLTAERAFGLIFLYVMCSGAFAVNLKSLTPLLWFLGYGLLGAVGIYIGSTAPVQMGTFFGWLGGFTVLVLTLAFWRIRFWTTYTRHLERKALEDPLTHLLNSEGLRAGVDMQRSREDETDTDRQTLGTLLFLDVDNLKFINDTFGHPAGDYVLIEMAERLRNETRDKDLVARVGGDEFVVFLPAVTDSEEVRRIANRIEETLRRPYHHSDDVLHSSVSIGASRPVTNDSDLDEVLSEADTAMYRAKRAGGAEVVLAGGGQRPARPGFEVIEDEIEHAIAEDEFEPYFQPIVDLDDGTLAGFEALARWNHPERGVLAPDFFLEAAETHRLVVPLGDQVVRKAVRYVRKWTEHHRDGMYLLLSFNLSLQEILRPDALRHIADLVEVSDLPGTRFMIEITEEAVSVIEGQQLEELSSFQNVGVQLSLDDFGTGQASMTALLDVPSRVIKLDQGLIQKLDTDEDARTVVESIVEMVHALGKKVIAEGIETERQLGVLRKLGVDHGQGFLLSSAVSGPDTFDLVSDSYPWQRYWEDDVMGK